MGRFVSTENTFDSGIPGNTVNFADVLNKPTTLAGYGITDGASINNIDFGSLVNKPTSLAGYGITDAAGLDVSFNNITDRPTTLAGYGITDAATIGGGGEITSLPFSSITNKPTTLAGYGITDAGSVSSLPFSSITNKPTDLAGYGITDAVTTAAVNGLVNTAVTSAVAALPNSGVEAPTVISVVSVTPIESLLPLNPLAFAKVLVIISNGLLTNSLSGNGKTIMGSTDPLIIDIISLPLTLQFINNDWKIV